MAQDIRYPGVRVGEACGQQPGLRDAKVMLTITIPLPYHYGIKPLCLGQRHGLGLGQGTSKPPKAKAKANGHKLVAMAQDIKYPGVRVYKPVGWELPLSAPFATFDL